MLENSKPIVLALGFFDSVHKGHQKVINKAFEIAREQGAEVSVFTFDGNLKKAVGNADEKCVFTSKERLEILKELGVKNVFFAPVDKAFLSMDKKEFLDFLNDKYNVVCYVSGKDYRFGKGGEGSVEYLLEYANSHNQNAYTVDTYTYNGKKISSTLIKEYIKQGDIERVNELLGREYSITGEVVKDRGVGSSMGFPTANIIIDEDRLVPKFAVYHGSVFIYGKEYGAIINLGSRPTFGLNNTVLEANLIDFNGDLYGEKITVKFKGFIREIQKFESVTDLKDQLVKDRKYLIERSSK